MLARARRKAPTLEWVVGDLLELPFEAGTFDAATIGFGIRNVSDLERGLAELRRVLRPGGRLAILEITRPRGVLRPFFSLWFDRIVPALGRAAARRRGLLLPAGRRSRRFPGAEELAELMRRAGFAGVEFRLLAGSIIALHTGTGPGSTEPVKRSRSPTSSGRIATPGGLAARTWPSSRPAWRARSTVARALPRRSRPRRSPPAESACGRCSASSPPTERDGEVLLAAGVATELVHMATLVHDDLVDGARMRRGAAGGLVGLRLRCGALGR